MTQLSNFKLSEETKKQLIELTTKHCADRKMKDNMTKCLTHLIKEAHKATFTLTWLSPKEMKRNS